MLIHLLTSLCLREGIHLATGEQAGAQTSTDVSKEAGTHPLLMLLCYITVSDFSKEAGTHALLILLWYITVSQGGDPPGNWRAGRCPQRPCPWPGRAADLSDAYILSAKDLNFMENINTWISIDFGDLLFLLRVSSG